MKRISPLLCLLALVGCGGGAATPDAGMGKLDGPRVDTSRTDQAIGQADGQPADGSPSGDGGGSRDGKGDGGGTSGTCRLFYTLDPLRPELGPKTLRSAVSTDGVTFRSENHVWFADIGPYADPAVRLGPDGVWRMVAAGKNGSTSGERWGIFYASNATPSFPQPSLIVKEGQVPDLLEVQGGLRVFYCGSNSFGGQGMVSVFSTDGKTFQPEDVQPVALPPGMAMTCDPTVARRRDGSYVMYFKAAPPYVPGGDNTPYTHMIYRAFSPDGRAFTGENVMLVNHASVPSAYTDAGGRVWVYFLYFGDDWPRKKETIWFVREDDDGSLTEPRPVVFDPPIPDGFWTNNPSPTLLRP